MEEEIKEEKLDSPLIVHKVTDASYQETANEVGMENTHTDDDSSDEPTLERHRFRKEKKKSKLPYMLAGILVIVAVVFAVLISKGVISFDSNKETTQATKKSYTTQVTNQFENTITVKGSFLFYEGVEIDGYEELERKVKYLDEGTKLIVQDENADSDFLNYEVLSLLSQYEIDYEITHIVSSGLVSKYETTVATTEATTESATEDATENAQ